MPKKRVPRVRQLGLSTRAQPLLEVSPTVNVTPEVNVTEEITSNPTFQVYPSIETNPNVNVYPSVESNPNVSVAAPEVSVELSPTFQVDIPDTWVSAVATVSVGARGLQSIPIAFKSTTAIYVNPGAIHLWDSTGETILYNNSTLSLDIGTVTANTWYYVYVQRPSSGTTIALADVSLSTSAPSQSLTKLGQYDSTGQKRCIGFVRTNTTTTIYEFQCINGWWISMGGQWSQDYASTPAVHPNFTTVTLSAPLGNTLVRCRTILLAGTGAGMLGYRGKGATTPTFETTVSYVTTAMARADWTEDFPVDNNKQVDICDVYAYGATVHLCPFGASIPATIYTGPSGGLERDVQGAVQQVDYGKKVGLKLSYASTSSFYVDGGVIHINDGSNDLILYTPSQLTKSVSGLSASTWYAVYVDPPDTGTLLVAADIEYSSTMPTWDHQKCGWYHPTTTDWRCIGFIRANGSSQITNFFINGKEWRVVEGSLGLLLGTTVTAAAWTTVTSIIPMGGLTTIAAVEVMITDGWTVLYHRITGFTAAHGQLPISCVTNAGLNRQNFHTNLATSSNKQFDVTIYSASTGATVSIYGYGFLLPDGM